MNKISAKIIADSVNIQGDRITSMELVMPRFSLPEFNTHRCFSRNSASSRAIPFKKMVKVIQENPFIPIKFMKDHSGMQGTEYFENEEDIKVLTEEWLRARDHAVNSAINLSNRGLTKQICNRLLEPYMWHKVLVTSTDYENFFALRAHEAAEIHIQDLAYKMLEEYNNSTPKLLKQGEWHIPYGDDMDWDKLMDLAEKLQDPWEEGFRFQRHQVYAATNLKVKVATARCARTSYTTIDTEAKHDYEKDIELTEKLSKSGHFSPFEHSAIAMNEYEYKLWVNGKMINPDDYHSKDPNFIKKEGQGWCGNFKGFIQYRKRFENENKKDDRINQKQLTNE